MTMCIRSLFLSDTHMGFSLCVAGRLLQAAGELQKMCQQVEIHQGSYITVVWLLSIISRELCISSVNDVSQ